MRLAQHHEIGVLFNWAIHGTAVDLLLENSEKVIDILRATGRKQRERKKKVGRPKGSRTKAVAANEEPVNNQPKEQ